MARAPAANELLSYTVANLIQGVSQQAPEQRRDTQCEAQWDCINSIVNGCEARPPFEVLRIVPNARFDNAWFRAIQRGTTESYVAVVSEDKEPADKLVRVFDLNSGEECSVTETASMDYLVGFEAPKSNLRATTLNDFTFMVNRETKPAMGTAVAPNAYNEAIFYFKAGGYKITFQASVRYGGNVFTFLYESPDNSVAANAAYITTNQLAATFYRAFTGGAATPITSGTAVSGGRTGIAGGVGAGAAGQTGVVGATTLTSLGFYVAINGNCILIGRSDTNAFTVDASDGVGDTYFKAIQTEVQAFSELPQSCFGGFTVKVIGTNKEEADDYYVTYSSVQGQGGAWIESVKPGVPIEIDASTMPHALVNTGYQQFDFRRPTWGQRVVGDGVDSSLDPSFIGKRIEDISFSYRRLTLVTEGTAVWSKARNPYVFFPSSAQTTLATDPVDVEVSGGDEVALLRKAVNSGDATFLWAEGIQFRVTSGQEVFKQGTVEAPPVSNYEFAPNSDPLSIGPSLYFISETDYTTIRELQIIDGKPRGDAQDITEHVRSYIPAGIRHHVASDALHQQYLISDWTPNQLYPYNYLLGEQNTRLQSAWNTWRFPQTSRIVWAKVRRNKLHLIIQRDDCAIIGYVDLTPNAADPEHSDRQTRVDFRLSEGQVIRSYDETTNETTIYLPYGVPEARGYVYEDEDSPATCPMFVATRTTQSEETPRGTSWIVSEIARSSTYGVDYIKVRGDCSSEELYIGFRITAQRDESQLFYRDAQGAIAVERLAIVNVVYTYSKSGYFRTEVVQRLASGAAPIKKAEMTGRVFGDPSNVMGSNPIRGGFHKQPVNLASTDIERLSVINDSFLPSRLSRLTVEFHVAMVAKPTASGAGRGQR